MQKFGVGKEKYGPSVAVLPGVRIIFCCKCQVHMLPLQKEVWKPCFAHKAQAWFSRVRPLEEHVDLGVARDFMSPQIHWIHWLYSSAPLSLLSRLNVFDKRSLWLTEMLPMKLLSALFPRQLSELHRRNLTKQVRERLQFVSSKLSNG